MGECLGLTMQTMPQYSNVLQNLSACPGDFDQAQICGNRLLQARYFYIPGRNQNQTPCWHTLPSLLNLLVKWIDYAST